MEAPSQISPKWQLRIFFFKYKPTRPKKMGKKRTVVVSKFMESGEQMLIDWSEQTRLKDRGLHRETD